MGLGPSRLTYVQPPPPPLHQVYNLDETTFHDKEDDPEGYAMCRSVAIKEGVLGAAVAMPTVSLAIYLTKKYATNARTIQKLLGYSPGVLFLVSSAGMSTAALFTEITLHDCTVQRGTYLTAYWASLGLGTPEEVDDPNRVKTLAWNVKRKGNPGGVQPAATSTQE